MPSGALPLLGVGGAAAIAVPPIAGYSLWLDRLAAGALYQDAAGSIAAAVGDPVGAWVDAAGVQAATQSGTSRPAVTASGVAFTRTDPDYLTHPGVALSAYTLYVVAQRLADAVNTRYVIGGTPFSGLIFQAANSNIGFFDGAVVRVGPASAQNRLAVWVVTQAGQLYENTTEIASGSALASITLTALGRRGDGFFPFDSEIRSCLYYPSNHDAAQRAAVVAFLAARHSVPV